MKNVLILSKCRCYNARKHPKYVNGDWTEDRVFEEYLKSFDSPNDPDGIVSHIVVVLSYNVETRLHFGVGYPLP